MKYRISFETNSGQKVTTWGVCPVTNNTKILDGIYNPEGKHLTLVYDSVTQNPKEFEIPDEKGKMRTQIRSAESYYQHKIQEEDIPFFLENYVENDFELEAAVESKLLNAEGETIQKKPKPVDK